MDKNATITATIEDTNGQRHQHPYHFGTNLEVAMGCAEKCVPSGFRSLALWRGGEIVAILDCMGWDRKEKPVTRHSVDSDELERAFERRAAFGPGVDVVNVITGERYKT